MTIHSLSNAFYIVSVCLDDSVREHVSIGVLLFVRSRDGDDRLYMKFRSDWTFLQNPELIDVLKLLPGDLLTKAKEMGPEKLQTWMEDSWSNAILIGDRCPLGDVTEPLATLAEIYDREISV